MRKKIFAILQYLFFLGIGIFLTWWQLGRMTPEEKLQFKESLIHARYIIILPVAIIALLSHLSRAMRWKIMMEPMGYHPSTANTFYATLCGYFANTFLPRVGEILRCTLLGRYEKIPVNKLVGTIVTERIFDLVCYFFVVVFTICIQINTVSDFVKKRLEAIRQQHADFPWWQLLLAFVVFIIIIMVLIRWIFKKYANHKHIITIKSIYTGLKEGITTIFRLKKRKAFLLHSLFIWSMYLIEIYVGFSALSATSGLGFGAAFSVLSLATIAMIVSPGGIGAFPVAIQQVLLIYAIDNISFGWLIWGTTTAIIIVAGLISFVLLIYTNKNKNEASGQVVERILSANELQPQLKRWRLINKTIAFTNGVFDILHEGHIKILSHAASFADILIVGVNSDASVKRLKGEARPVNNEHSRSLLLASLIMVDAAIIFEEDTPLNLIKIIMPDVLIKGGDYTLENIVGAKEVMNNGGKVEIIPLEDGFSTTGIIEKMKKN